MDQTEVYEQDHVPSPFALTQLSIDPVKIPAGKTVGLYVHAQYRYDTALVYDNRRSEIVYEDDFIEVHPGMAHLDPIPFGNRNPWGHGRSNAFRSNRTFVGRLVIGAKYILWNPDVHASFPKEFRRMVAESWHANQVGS